MIRVALLLRMESLPMQVRFIAALLLMVTTATADPISSSDIRVVDGDTIDIGRDRYRLVGSAATSARTNARWA